MSQLALTSPITADAYLAWEREQDGRHEFHHCRREADGGWRYGVAEASGAIVLAEGASLDVDAVYAGAFDLELG